jgi:hypothetical protein
MQPRAKHCRRMWLIMPVFMDFYYKMGCFLCEKRIFYYEMRCFSVKTDACYYKMGCFYVFLVRFKCF